METSISSCFQLLKPWETQVWSLGWKDPLEKRMATHANILAWRIPRMEEPGGLQSKELQRVGHDWATEHAPSPDSLPRGLIFTFCWSQFSHLSLNFWDSLELASPAPICSLLTITLHAAARVIFLSHIHTHAATMIKTSATIANRIKSSLLAGVTRPSAI